MFSDAEMQLVYKVANEPIRMFPYPHFLIHDVFPPAFYRALREHLPPPGAYKTLTALKRVVGDYPDARMVVPLTPGDIEPLAEPYRSFWTDFAQLLLGGRFGQALLGKFSSLLAQRFENPTAMEYTQEALVVQDRTDYVLGPHTDAPTKVFSLLFYLPADDSKPHLGTSMYMPVDPSFTCPGGPHYDFERFQRVITMPYVPNTLFGFMKSANAFHGVERIADPAIERALILYDVKFKPQKAEPPRQAVPNTAFTF